MTDRELLELAAKAAGIEQDARYPGCYYSDKGAPWNPLTDDGDALRLAVRLGISGTWHAPLRYATAVYCPFGPEPVIRIEERGDDSYAATRRAIVRAAAQIGQEKP